ncbi:F-box protein [Quillaja saponaria]|uniref:F-box protein n=1 Tax=Quillaja saponaria TaxID=32244 RepID=A0AAD7Q7Z7_QUISA|nr:F-box protein [Quillaja saponaria]
MKEDERKVCLLDFPESVLESILERLSPAELCRVSTVCNSLRIKCTSDYLWKKHMKQKWGGLISSNAYQQSQFNDSIMSCYLSLESGRLMFPAQVYGRKNGGYALSCYNAQVSYDYKTNTFQARYSPVGWRTVEGNVPWDRLREPPLVDTSDCDLNDWKPGDHIEILWSGRKEDPCGWWYAVLSHLQSCDGNVMHCRCQYSG